MKLKKIYTLIGASMVAVSLCAAPVDDARRMYREGDYAGAIETLRKLIKSKPKDGTVNYYLGASLYAMGDYSQARKYLEQAQSRGVADASRLLAIGALDNYLADDAADYIDDWEAALKKAKKTVPDELAELQGRAVRMRNMLERVEKIEILDSISVDSADFFKVYRLSEAAGRILPPEAVQRAGAGREAQSLSLAYIPQNNSELLWAASDSSEVFNLFGANILDDGTLDHTRMLDGSLAGGGNAKFPFLMPDGVTLYYASDGENSLGGYDIFMTRRNENEDGAYYQPQNMGMPYNSPYNDYMLAIDETSGLGWFATDRNRIPGKVTVYVFAPSAMRVNADSDDPNLVSLAKLDNIALTRRQEVDYSRLLAGKLPQQTQVVDTAPRLFALDMGNGKIYTTLADFTNKQARSAMLEAMATKFNLDKHLAAEAELRERYRKGARDVSTQILDSERETETLRRRYASQVNNAVRLEKTR